MIRQLDRTLLARQAMRLAARVRRKANIAADRPICVFDLAETVGVEVKFRPEPSLEGMHISGGGGTILLAAQRPSGRKAFTCGHELGHHFLDHGTRVDEYLANVGPAQQDDPDELAANLFAGHLLMPEAAVQRAFRKRGLQAGACGTMQIYTVANELGVSYEALIQHMRWSLGLLSDEQSSRLLHASPKAIRTSVLGRDPGVELKIVDDAWDTVAIDLQVGALAVLPLAVELNGASVRLVDSLPAGMLAEAVQPGVSRVTKSGGTWAAFVRVCRCEYVGRSCFRFLEDTDEH